jgi:putative ABC transport system substrate-binding protein
MGGAKSPECCASTAGPRHDGARTGGRIALQGCRPFLKAQYVETFRALTRAGAQALLVGPTGEHWGNRHLIAELALRNRLPTMARWREFVEAGGLMAYGVSTPENWRRAASYVDRILKGAKPGDLPIEQPTKFELWINGKTARALGLAIPSSMLARADEIIE